MSSESLAIVGLTLIALALPAMGAWFYQVFALKRELADTERRLSERVTRVENDVRDAVKCLQALAKDQAAEAAHVRARLDELARQGARG